MANVQLDDLRNCGNRFDVVIVQPVTRIYDKTDATRVFGCSDDSL